LARAQLQAALTATPALHTLLESFKDSELVDPIKIFLEEWRLEGLDHEFVGLVAQGAKLDLERGAVLLARLAYPKLTHEATAHILDRLAEDAAAQLKTTEGTAHPGAILARYLYQDLDFRGNESNYYDPDNSYINRVLERRTGIPISLSCVYVWVGTRLKLPVFGAGLPGHFITGCRTHDRPLYFDAFNRGRILTPTDCARIVHRSGIEFQDRFLAPMPTPQIMARMIVNLMNLYTERNDQMMMQRLSQWSALLQEPSASSS